MEISEVKFQMIKGLADKRGMSLDKGEFSKILKMAEGIPDVREDKVNRVKEQLASGKYDPPLANVVSATSDMLND